MEYPIPITYLNDYIFCPYSIYLHQIYGEIEEEHYHSTKQSIGKSAHSYIDNSSVKNSKQLKGIYVFSEELQVYGKIDIYLIDEKELVERKYFIQKIYQGYYYQLWAQYLCMIEMGYDVQKIAFYSIKTNQKINVLLPTNSDIELLKKHIQDILNFHPSQTIKINPEKCKNCIYAAMCDKTEQDHVYA